MDPTDPKVVQFPGVRMRGPDPVVEVVEVEPAPAPDPIAGGLAALDDLRQLIERGEVDGFVVIAKHKPTGLPYTDIAFPQHKVPPADAFFYMGVLECVKNELADIACMAPSVLADGSILDPECAR